MSTLERLPVIGLFKDGQYFQFLAGSKAILNTITGVDKSILKYYMGCAQSILGQLREALDTFRELVDCGDLPIEYLQSIYINLGLISLSQRDPEFCENCRSMYQQLSQFNRETSYSWETSIKAVQNGTVNLKDYTDFVVKEFSNKHVLSFYCLALELLNQQKFFMPIVDLIGDGATSATRVIAVAIECLIGSGSLNRAKSFLEIYRLKQATDLITLKADFFELKIMRLEGNHDTAFFTRVRALRERVRAHPRSIAGEIHSFCNQVLVESTGIKRVLVSRRHGMIGESPQLEQVREQIDLYANSDLNVLIRGASGTGKELVAIAMHQNSRRRDQSFVPVNCFHLGTQLAEARLFGHRKGAFTGAAQDAPGFVHEAHGGTLFLDEIGELPLEAQANLFRFLDSGQFRRVGSTEQEKANVRVIAATNQDLSQDSRFRHELYHRLGTVIIDLPPLAERGTDILHIARCRVAELNVLGGFTKTLSVESERKLGSYDWPGNVRELLNVIDRAWHASSQEIAPDVLRFDRRISLHIEAANGWVPDLQRDVVDLDEAVNRYTARLVQEMHARCNRDAAETARRLNISERTVYRWIKRSTEDPGAEAPSA